MSAAKQKSSTPGKLGYGVGKRRQPESQSANQSESANPPGQTTRASKVRSQGWNSQSTKPVLAVGSWSLMVEQRQKAIAFDLLVNGGYIARKKADQALEIASAL